MANEIKIPGLKESIDDMTRLFDVTKKQVKVLLELTLAGEKSSNRGANKSLKESIELDKEAQKQKKQLSVESDKLLKAEKNLAFAQSDAAKKIAEYNVQIQKQNSLNKDAAKTIELTDAQIKKEATSIADARNQITLLTQARNNVNTTTVEGREKLLQLNNALDSNNKFIKENADGYLKQKLNIGNYAKGMQEAIEKTGLANGKIGEVTRTIIGFTQQGGKAVKQIKEVNDKVIAGAKSFGDYATSNKLATSIKKIFTTQTEIETLAIEGSTVATAQNAVVVQGFARAETLATVATETSTVATEAQVIATEANILAAEGMAVGQIAVAATSETMAVAEGTAVVATSFLNVALGILLAPITLVVLALGLLIYIFKDFAPIVNPIKDAFSALSAVFGTLKQAIFDLVTGARSFKEIFSSFTSDAKEAASAAMDLAKSQREVAKAQDINEVANSRAQTRIQELILQSKNRTLSEKERIKLIQEAQDIEEKAFKKTNDLNNRAIDNAKVKLFEGKKVTKEELKSINELDYAAIRSIKIKKNLNNDDLESFKSLLIKKEELAKTDQQIREKAENRKDQLADRQEKKIEKQNEDAKKASEDNEKRQQEAAKDELDRLRKAYEYTITTKKATLDYLISSYKFEENLENTNLAHVKTVALEKIVIANLEQKKSLVGIAKNSKEETSIIANTAQEIKKIKLEESNALRDISLKNKQLILETYGLQNESLIENAATLTDVLLEEEKSRIRQQLQLQKEYMRATLNIDKNLTDGKLKIKQKSGQDLTENERKYLNFILKEEKDNAKKTQAVDKIGVDYKLKANDTEEKDAVRKNKLLGKGATANTIFQNRETDKKLKKDKIALKENEKNLKIGTKEHSENAKAITEIDDAVAQNDIDLKKIVSDAKRQALMQGLALVTQVAGEESTIGKAAAIAAATINTYEAANATWKTASESPTTILFPGYPALMVGLTIAAGLANVSKIAGVDFFEKGTDFAPYTGIGVIDEIGPEIHTDFYGNIKSMGSDGGAHYTNIERGDVVIPADISAIIRQNMFKSYGISQSQIDYSMIGKEFGKHADRIVSSIKNQSTSETTIDKNGMNYFIRTNGQKTQKMNNHLRLK